MRQEELEILVNSQQILTKREIYALWMMTNYDIHRYVMCIVRGEVERSMRHWHMSAVIAAFIDCEDGEYVLRNLESNTMSKCAVHEWLAENLTDFLDEKIGLPLSDEDPITHKTKYIDYGLFTFRFFRYIIQNFSSLIEYVKNYDL